MQAGKANVGKRLGRGGENELGETLDSLASKKDSLRNIGQKLELFRFYFGFLISFYLHCEYSKCTTKKIIELNFLKYAFSSCLNNNSLPYEVI